MTYLLVISLWPWPPYRFIVPILPFLAPYLLLAIRMLLKRLSFLSGNRWLLLTGLSVLVAANVVFVHSYGVNNRYTSYPSLSGEQVFWSSYEEIFMWLTKNSEPDDVIASGRDTMIYLYTGRPAFLPFVLNPVCMFYGGNCSAIGSGEDLINILGALRPRYLLDVPMPGFSAEKPFSDLVHNLLVDRPGWLKQVYVGSDPRFVIFEIQWHVKPSD